MRGCGLQPRRGLWQFLRERMIPLFAYFLGQLQWVRVEHGLKGRMIHKGECSEYLEGSRDNLFKSIHLLKLQRVIRDQLT